MSASNRSYEAIFSILLLSCMQCHAQLSATFYDNTCPNALNTIRTSIRQAVSYWLKDYSYVFLLHGCDASILLNETTSMISEKTALPNLGSVRGYGVIEDAKAEIGKICPGWFHVGGPSWTVKLGRRDSTTASKTVAETDLPNPFDPLDTLISGFANKGLNTRDMPKHNAFYSVNTYGNGTDIDASFASTRRRACPQEGENGNLAPLDLVTPNQLVDNYFKNLIDEKGLLQSDQVLFNGGSTDSIVTEYSNSPRAFSSDFAAAMIKMGDITPLTDQNGIIRSVCASVN
ncbi:hypothetical protein R3W88_029600 [Solanum pinnatisectum]|uniref:Peroxidase n=1 Tax=Solanum pinnatisectum TaxID=50273 RepID=A0AAV9K7K0_9SOLN|nr:hypothetical protein R3W88_029600 [Solanum pinnatisectum]